MHTNRLLALAGVAAMAVGLMGCIVPPPRGHGPDRDRDSYVRDRDGDGRFEDRGDRDMRRDPLGLPPGSHGPRY